MLDISQECSFRPCFLQYGTDPFLVNSTKGLGRHFQRNPFIFLRNIELLFLEILVKTMFGLVVGFGRAVTVQGTLPGDVIFTCHIQSKNSEISIPKEFVKIDLLRKKINVSFKGNNLGYWP